MPLKLKHRELGETLTNKIKTTIRDYNCNAVSEAGISTVREFLANAEDAKASTFSVVLDNRAYPTETLLAPGLSEWQGPALCFYNDSQFTEDDWKSFERIGESLKAADGKIGQFGLGSLTGYFVTDVQQILSGHNLVIVDPHKTYTEGIECRKNMVFLDITDMTDDVEDEVCDDQLEPFKCIDEYVQKGDAGQMLGLHGTMFRLPFRTASTAEVSEISNDLISAEEKTDLLDKVATMATELILFTKWVKSISVYVIKEDGAVSCTMHTEKDQEDVLYNSIPTRIKGFRGSYNSFKKWLAEPDTGLSCEELCVKPTNTENYFFQISAQNGGEVELAALIKSRNDNGEVTHFPELFPEGLVFYVMPMTFTKTCLPLHINARFKIQSDRRSLLTDVSDSGKGDHNKELSREKVGPLWAALIYSLVHSESEATSQGTQDVNTILKRLWPPLDCNNIHPRPLELAAEAMLKTAIREEYELLWTEASGGQLVSLSTALFLPEHVADLPAEVLETCQQIGLPVVNPPKKLKFHFEDFAKANVQYLEPGILRKALQGKKVTKKVCKKILNFVLSDEDYQEMNGLQLVPIQDKRQLGFFEKRDLASTKYYICDEKTTFVPQLIKQSSIHFLDVDDRLEEIFRNQELQLILNIAVPGPQVVGENLQLPVEDINLNRLWMLIQSWENDKIAWEPCLSSLPIVPMKSGGCLSLSQCRHSHVITPSMQRVLSERLCGMLSDWGCRLVSTTVNEKGSIPWACAFKNKSHAQENVAQEILECICTSSVQEAQGYDRQAVSELVELLRLTGAQPDSFAQIPIFNTLDGTMISIHGKNVQLLPRAFDKPVCHKYIAHKSNIVVRKSHWEQIHSGPSEKSIETFFVNSMLPMLTRAISQNHDLERSLQEVHQVLDTAFTSFWQLGSPKLDHVAQRIKNSRAVLDLNHKTFHTPGEFAADILSNTLAAGGSKTFRHLEQGSKGYSHSAVGFLKRAGVHHELTGQALVECLKGIEHRIKQPQSTLHQTITYTIPQIINKAVEELQKGHNQSDILYLLKKPVFPVQNLYYPRTIGVCAAKEQYVLLSDAADWQHHSLVASSLPYLKEELKNLATLRQMMGISKHPDVKHVLKHLMNIAKPEGLFDQWASKGEAVKQLMADYKVIWKHLKDISRTGTVAQIIVDTLRDQPCVEVYQERFKGRYRFAKATELSLDETMETVEAPFRVPAILREKEYTHLLRRMGATQFLWTFLEKIGCQNVREANMDHFDSVAPHSMQNNIPGSVVCSILDGLQSVAPTDEEKKRKLSAIRSQDEKCWDQLRTCLGSPGCNGGRVGQIPVFETVEGEYISPANKAACVLPAAYESEAIHDLLKENEILILKNNTDCERRLNRVIREVVPEETAQSFFKKWLLACLKNTKSSIPPEKRLELLKSGLMRLGDLPEEEIMWVKHENIVMDPCSGIFFRASEYVCSGSVLFHFIFADSGSGPHKPGQIEMLPQAFRDSALQKVMKIAGLHTELNVDLLYACLDRIHNMNHNHRNDNLQHILEILKMCTDNTEKLSSRCMGFLEEEEVFPVQRSLALPAETLWEPLSKLCDHRHEGLVAPLYRVAVKELSNLNKLRSHFGFEASPGVTRVVKNLLYLGRSKDVHQQKDASTVDTVRAAWEYLCAQFAGGRDGQILCSIEKLKDKPCVQLSCGRFVKPELSYDQMVDTGKTPYPVPDYLRSQEYVALLRYLGVQGDLDVRLPVIHVRGEKAQSVVMKHLGESFNTPEDSDVIFCVEDQHIHAHKVILRRSWLFFQRMFSGDWSHKTKDGKDLIELDVPGASFQALYVYLQYVYKGEVLGVNGSSIQGKAHGQLFLDLLQLADACGDDYMKSFCEQRIVYEHYVDPQNCCEILPIAHCLRALQLQEACVEILRRNKGSLQLEIGKLSPEIRNEIGVTL